MTCEKMGSENKDEKVDCFQETKTRINNAFEHLRKEMKEIQKQDILLLKQMMYIRHTILLLSHYGDRRSYSISALEPPSNNTLAPPQMSPYPRRNPLTRVQSAPMTPMERKVSEDTIPEEDDTDDELGHSFNSTASDSHIIGVINRPTPETDFIYALGPLPPVFKRLIVSSTSDSPPDSVEGLASDTYTQTLLKQLASTHTNCPSFAESEQSLLRLVAKRRLLQRQKSVDEYESLEQEIAKGHAIIESLTRMNSSSVEVEV